MTLLGKDSLRFPLLLACLIALSICASVSAVHAEKLYESDFASDKVSDAWSVKDVGTTPNHKRKCLGPFSNSDKAEMSLKKLPRHDLVSVEVELFVLGPWSCDEEPSDDQEQ